MRDGYIIIDGHVHTFSSETVSGKIRESFNRLYSIEFENPGNKPYCLTAIGGDAQVMVAGESMTELPASSSVIVPADVVRVTVRADSALEVVRATP